MKKLNKRAVAGIAVALLTIFTILTICLRVVFVGREGNQKDRLQTDQQKQDRFRFNEDGTVTLGEGFTSHGFYTKDGKLADFGSAVECEDGCIRGCIVFQQNLPGTTEYGLLMMEDFIQKEFKVGNVSFDCYRFSLSGEGTARIEVELPVMDRAYEIEYLIVPQPDAQNFSMDSKSGWNNFLATKNAYTSSYKIMDKHRKKVKIIKTADEEARERLRKVINGDFPEVNISISYDIERGPEYDGSRKKKEKAG